MNQNRKRMTLPIDRDFNRKSLKNKNLMSENTDEKIDFSKSIISQFKKIKKVKRVKRGTSMILCFYRQEFENFKEKHKIIDVPFLTLFSTIFYDFHLFDRLYGLKDIDADRVNDLLRVMRLDHKVRFDEDRFSTLDLSTGQRKRLAMVEIGRAHV